MPEYRDLQDGECAYVKGSVAKPYELKNTGGVFSCSCPAWRNQSVSIERRTCKHLRGFRGADAESARVGNAGVPPPTKSPGSRSTQETAPPVLLAHPWDGSVDVAGWWMSEKLDGVRAYWDGSRLLSRLGNAYHAPDWFLDGLPRHALDGELWMGRKLFQKTVSVARRQDMPETWKQMSYVLFDLPDLDAPFEERMRALEAAFAAGKHPYARFHPQLRCEGHGHLNEELARVLAAGGEGIMVRMPGSPYVAGRSETLLKVKAFHDAEARVLTHIQGRGKHKGRLGALGVELANGVRFSVGTGFSDAERRCPPPIGCVVTFRYQELTDGGVPRFPSFVRARTDDAADAFPASPASSPPAAELSALPRSVAASGTRRFELSDAKSSKFWEVSLAGTTHTVVYGRIGTDGTSKTKQFPSAEAASNDAEKLVKEKVRKGYRETS